MLNALILFAVTFATGLAVFKIPVIKPIYFKYSLAFSGAYLFTLTLVHILPELFSEASSPYQIGLFVVLGFLLQVVIEFFTEGVEHGHLHHHENHESHSRIYTLLIALFIHALLEGSLLGHPSHHHHEEDNTTSLLFGMVLHKIPEAFALASVLLSSLTKRRYILLCIICFAAASPIGILGSNFIGDLQIITPKGLEILFGIVAGNFLHISTTIFFETSPEHQFSGKRMLCIISGISIAAAVEILL